MTNKLEAKTGLTIPGGRRYLDVTPGDDLQNLQAQDHEVEQFLITLAALQRLMTFEQQLLGGIIPVKWHKRILEMITRDSLDIVVKEGEAITTRVRKSISSCDFTAVLTQFHILRQLAILKPAFEKTLECCDTTVKNKINEIFQHTD